MFQFFSGASSKSKFTDAPTTGKPSLAVGTGTFNGGAAPDFQGIAALGVDMAAGYANNLLDLQVAGVSKFAVTKDGVLNTQGALSSNGNTITTGGGTLATGALSSNVRVEVANYAIVGFADFTIIVNAASLIITLPNAASRAGYMYCIKNTTLGNTTTIASTAGLIDGAATDTTSLANAKDHAIYQSDGTNWWKIA